MLDTGIFDDDRYWDVFVEYAKAGPDDILMLVTLHNRGPEEATIHLLPQLWFRNTWSWKHAAVKPELSATPDGTISARHAELGYYLFGCDGQPELLFCDNDTNLRRLYAQSEARGHFKDAFHEYLIAGDKSAVNPQQIGTKAAAHYRLTIPAGGSARVQLRLAPERGLQSAATSGGNGSAGKNLVTSSDSWRSGLKDAPQLFADFDALFAQRRREADEFYAELEKDIADPDARLVQRQAFAGMIWSKQFFYFDVPEWLRGDPGQPPPAVRAQARSQPRMDAPQQRRPHPTRPPGGNRDHGLPLLTPFKPQKTAGSPRASRRTFF